MRGIDIAVIYRKIHIFRLSPSLYCETLAIMYYVASRDGAVARILFTSKTITKYAQPGRPTTHFPPPQARIVQPAWVARLT